MREFMLAHAATPFGYGTWDCLIMFGAVCELQTGLNPAQAYVGSYADEYGAAKILRRDFGGSVESAVAKYAAPVSHAQAQNGNCAITASDKPATALLCDGRWHSIGNIGWSYVPAHMIAQVYRIQCRKS